MNPVEAVSPWISSQAPVARSPRSLGGLLPSQGPELLAFRPLDPAGDRRESAGDPVPAPAHPAPARMWVGAFSLRQIVDAAVAGAEGEAIRRALTVTHGNKSQAARLLRTNYTTLHAKMRRYGIPARESKL